MATQSINFGGLGLVKFNNVTCNTVKVNGATVYTAALASYSYSTTRDNLYLDIVNSDTKTFPKAVASGYTTIRLKGRQYAHSTSHGTYTNTNVVSVWFYVKLYSGSTLLHTTARQRAILPTGTTSSSAYDMTFAATTVSKKITKAILYREGGVRNTAICHAKDVCTVIIG